MVRELNDRAAEGRAFGNLGNTHYLLGNFDKAVQYHEEVWSIYCYLSPRRMIIFNRLAEFIINNHL